MLEQDKMVELKEEDIEKVSGGTEQGEWINGVFYTHIIRTSYITCENCCCNGYTYFCSVESIPLRGIAYGVHKCYGCGHVWEGSIDF